MSLRGTKVTKLSTTKNILFTLLAVLAASAFAQTLADAHKAYVAGKWQEAATAYEAACPKEPDSVRAECYLWNVLALSQTGSAQSFKVAGHRLDSLIQTTSPEKTVYSEMLLTKAQFMLYIGKNDRAAEILIQAIDNSKPKQAVILQKVCSAVLSQASHQELSNKCKSVKDSSLYLSSEKKITQAVAPTPVVEPVSKPKNETKIEQKGVTKPEIRNLESTSYWTLQLGAFGVESNAKILIDNLKKQGLDGRIETRIGENRTLYLVQIGKFSSKEEAVDFGAKKITPLNMEFQPIQKK